MVSSSMQTYIGNVVVSLNPYQPLKIYTPAKIMEYSGRHLYELPPHIYAPADEVRAIMLLLLFSLHDFAISIHIIGIAKMVCLYFSCS